MLNPPLSYDEQIDYLQHHHQLNISDENTAKEILSKVNYYRLMGYGIGLTQSTNSELYLESVTLEHIFQLYCFDSQLRNNLIRTLEQLEIQLKTQISHLLGIKYGADLKSRSPILYFIPA